MLDGSSRCACAAAVFALALLDEHQLNAASAPGVSDIAQRSGETPSPDEADIVETIDQRPAASTPSSAVPPTSSFPAVPAAKVPPVASAEQRSLAHEAERFELHGWARQTLQVGLSKRDPQSADGSRTAVPYDQLTAQTQMFLRARYARGGWFEANVSGALSYSLFERAPVHADTTFDGFNGQSVRGAVEPALHELFLGFFSSQLDMRIGQQR